MRESLALQRVDRGAAVSCGFGAKSHVSGGGTGQTVNFINVPLNGGRPF